jgi:predicted DNA-binding transcriptional regulator YafY
MRIDRLLSIIVMLLNNDRVSATSLAEKYEVSRRTIYRDIDAINLAGVPVISYPGNSGGFGIIENYKIDRQVLTLKDMVSIISALKGINQALEDQELDSAINKITSLIPKDKTEHLELNSGHIVFDILPWGHRKSRKDMLKTIHKCIINNNLIIISYLNNLGIKNTRTIEPMTLLFKGYSWYLFAFCNLKNDYRLFRISRIKSMEVLDKTFIRRKKTYNDVMDFESINSSKLMQVKLKFNKKLRVNVEDYFNDDEIEYLKNGDMIVEIKVPEDQDWIYGWVLGYGNNVEVLEPEKVRKNMKDELNSVLNKYIN